MTQTDSINALLAHHWQELMRASPLVSLEPTFWANGSHLQTLLGHLMPSETRNPKGESVTVTLADGDQLQGTYYCGSKPVLVYFFHGLGGSTQADYMKRGVDLSLAKGFHVLAMNHRGCGLGRGLAKHPYHSGRGEDLSDVIAYGRKRFPNLKHLCVGFSLSGNALLLLLSGKRGTVQPDGAIAVNAPIHLGHAAEWIHKGLNRIYEVRFVIKCARSVKQRQEDGLLTVPCSLPPWISLQEVDHRYTAPAGGFKDPQDYYTRCSTYQLLDRIRIPTAVLTAADDPFVPVADYQQASLSPMVFCHIEPKGGHMGYLSKRNVGTFGKRWLDYALNHFLTQLTKLLANHTPSEHQP